ncbi:MAG: DUF5522 domain-containing protein [Pyrinomonadaceae bacterium]
MQDSTQKTEADEKLETFIEGLDFYSDEGLMVLTRHYLINRGHCCGNKCRHCPYDTHDVWSLE